MSFNLTEDPSSLSRLIRQHRKAAHLSQTELALLAGVSRTAIQRIERGEVTVQLDTLLGVLKALNIQIHATSSFLTGQNS
jgi:HTH-type transcriptional regulator/antitoxin HipB